MTPLGLSVPSQPATSAGKISGAGDLQHRLLSARVYLEKKGVIYEKTNGFPHLLKYVYNFIKKHRFISRNRPGHGYK